ncbi:hypothetical protein [Ruminococcus albus]|uniref:DUF3021 domain-containing protein n=1 Tax=Ruminococcus albus TaxID=1264 RepID=A0A1I1PJP4_RUMAL|nr:hypothetical protein [Ruminococcus albus]SFD10044.1 hypothetical protein SAMN02910406_03093 [Ruminococcus albus]
MNYKIINDEGDKFCMTCIIISLLLNIGIAYLYMTRFNGFNIGIQLLIAFLITLAAFGGGQIYKYHIGHIIQVVSSICYASFITGFGAHLFKYKEITLIRTIAFLFIIYMELGVHIFIWAFRDRIINKYKHIMRRE